MDLTHLNALHVRLSHERNRLNTSKSENERKMRQVWVNGIEKEIAHECLHLGITFPIVNDISDEDLLKQLDA